MISKRDKKFTAAEVCSLLDDISARIDITAKLHKSLALMGDSNGVNLGNNQDSTVAPGASRTYTWYAGTIEAGPNSTQKATPVAICQA